MPQRTYDISVFRGAVGSADPQDIDVGEASFAQNVSFVDKIGSLQGLTKDELLVTSNLKTDNGNIISPLAHTEGGSTGVHTIVGIQTRGFSNSSLTVNNRVIGLSVYKEDAEQLFRSSKIYQGADRVESDVVHAYAEMNDGIYFGSSAYTPKVVEIIDHNQFGATPVNDKAFPGGVVALDIVDGGSSYTGGGLSETGVTGTGFEGWYASNTATGEIVRAYVTNGGSGYTANFNATIAAGGSGANISAIVQTAPANLGAMYFVDNYNAGIANSLLDLRANANFEVARTTSVKMEKGEYQYYYATILNGFEETPLNASSTNVPNFLCNIDVGSDTVQSHTFHFRAYRTLDPRVTGAAIYRKFAAAKSEISEYTPAVYVGTLDLTVVGEGDTANPYETYINVVYDETPSAVVDGSYNDRTGIPQTLDAWTLSYSLVETADAYMFYGRADLGTTSNIESTSPSAAFNNPQRTILRSKPYRPNVIDYSQDFLVVPHEPIALVAYGGRLFSFAKSTTTVIDPISLTILDTFDDIGILTSTTFAKTESGLFWCDARSCYQYDGTKINRIGDSIATNDQEPTFGWVALASGIDALSLSSDTTSGTDSGVDDVSSYNGCYVYYDAVSKNVFFSLTVSGQTKGWAFNLVAQAWTFFDNVDRENMLGVAYKEEGGPVVFSSNASGAYVYGHSDDTSNRTAFEWVSKDLTFDLAINDRKAMYRIQAHGNIANVEVSRDGGAFTNISLGPVTNGIREGNDSGSGTTNFFRTARVKLKGTSDHVMDSLSMRVRGLGR